MQLYLGLLQLDVLQLHLLDFSIFLNATTDGVVRFPSGFAIIFASLPSKTATAEFVVLSQYQ